MNNKVDKLFKDKLSAHTLAPSAQAWGKVEAQLSKKNKGIIWFRMAAVLTLVGLLTFIWWPRQKKEQNEMAIKHPFKKETEVPKPPTQNPTDNKESDQQQSAKQPYLSVQSQQKTHTQVPEQIAPVSDTVSQAPNLVAIEKRDPEIIKQEETVATPTTTPVETAEVAKVARPKSIKLTFSLPTVEQTTEEATVAANADEPKTPLQKAADKVNEIRTGDVFGSLRDAKNDLFAWDFKKDKTKKQQ